MSDLETTVSPGEAALILRKNPRTIARWADEGKLPVHHLTKGGQRRFLLADVTSLIDEPELDGAA